MKSGPEPFIWTYSNIKFYPLDPRPKDVRIEDIAHALAQMCRANGHFKIFYSVAQHSLNCAGEARARGLSRRVQLACLLHDASEAYISDLSRPVKRCLREYQAIEERLQRVIYSAFLLNALTADECFAVNEIDDTLLQHEFEQLHDQRLEMEHRALYSRPDFREKNITLVKAEFIRSFQRLVDPQQIFFKSVGIDGCKGGWAVFWIDSEGNSGFERCRTMDEIFPEHDDADCVLIDIPIGLPDSKMDIRPDGELRKRLKGKESSVFETPCHDAVYASTRNDMQKLNHAILGKYLSPYSVAFSPKIKEVNEFLTKNTIYIDRIRESHPEYAFCVMNDGKPILNKKKDKAGSEDRLVVLQKYFRHARQALDAIRGQGYPESIENDILDAMALAVMGRLGLEHGFATIPAEPQRDPRGLAMEIVYCKPLKLIDW